LKLPTRDSTLIARLRVGAGRTMCVLLTTESGVTESIMVFKPRKYGMKRAHSRGVDKTVRTAVDKDIIDEPGRKSATNRAHKRGPDPVLTTIIEDCIKNGLGIVTEQLRTSRTLPSVTDHCGHDAGPQITRRIDGESYGRTVKEDQMTVRTTCLSASRMPRQYQG
jgi:hypothetical protein